MLLDARQFSVELLSVLLPLLLLLLPPLTQSPKAIFSATSLLSALVLLTNYSSGTKPFSVPTAQLFFFSLSHGCETIRICLPSTWHWARQTRFLPFCTVITKDGAGTAEY
jgi:hypothetical protein